VKEFEICPLCGRQNWAVLNIIKEAKSYRELHCQHYLWDPSRGKDFSKEFLKGEKNNPAIGVPQFHALNLDVVPSEALEENREMLEKVLKNNLYEVNGWWFGTLEERENACKELVELLNPVCDFYSQHSKTHQPWNGS